MSAEANAGHTPDLWQYTFRSKGATCYIHTDKVDGWRMIADGLGEADAKQIVAEHNSHTRLESEVAALRDALKAIARQPRYAEMDEDDQDGVDFAEGYDKFVDLARAALARANANAEQPEAHHAREIREESELLLERLKDYAARNPEIADGLEEMTHRLRALIGSIY